MVREGEVLKMGRTNLALLLSSPETGQPAV